MKQLTLAEKKVIYYKLCDLITIFDRPHNYCNIHKTVKGRVTCNKKYTTSYLCCSDCRYADPEKGCKTKSLACKISYCIVGRTPYVMGLSNDLGLNEDRKTFIAAIRTVIKNFSIPYVANRASFEDSI